MYLLTQGESSVSSVQPARRKRGRPRKFETLTTPEAAHTPASVGMKECLPSRTRGPEPLLGQAITGVVEAASDSGYLLSVKIGNTSMRGVAFRPGHCVPVSAENDVTPNVPTIKRRKNRAQTASKQKYEPPKTIVSSSRLRISNRGDEDVEMVEPLPMLLPPVQNNTQDGEIEDGKEALESKEIERITELIKAFQEDVNEGDVQGDESTSLTKALFDEIMKTETVVGQIFVNEITPGVLEDDDGLSNTDTTRVVQEEKGNSSQTLHGDIEVEMEAWKFFAENGGITELFKEDVNVGELQIGSESTAVIEAEFDEIMTTEADIPTEVPIVVGLPIADGEIEDEMETLESSGDNGGISEPFKEDVNEGELEIGGESTAVIEADFDEIMTTEADIPTEVPMVVGLPITDTSAVVQEEEDNSSQTLDGEIEDEMEALESIGENGGISEPFKEDVNEGEQQIGRESTSVTQAEFDEIMTTEANGVNQIFVNEITPKVQQDDDGSSNTDTTAVAQEEMEYTGGSLQTLDGEIEVGKETLKSSAGNTDILKDDVIENEVQGGGDKSTSVTEAEFDVMMATEADCKDESIVP